MTEPGVGYSKLVGVSLPLRLESGFYSIEAEINRALEESKPYPFCHATSPLGQAAPRVGQANR
jgi:hypothetical protein